VLEHPGGAVLLNQHLRAVRRDDLGEQVTVGRDGEGTAHVVAGQPEGAPLVHTRAVELVDPRGRSTHELVALVTHIDVLAGWIHGDSVPKTRPVPVESIALEKRTGRT